MKIAWQKGYTRWQNNMKRKLNTPNCHWFADGRVVYLRLCFRAIDGNVLFPGRSNRGPIACVASPPENLLLRFHLQPDDKKRNLNPKLESGPHSVLSRFIVLSCSWDDWRSLFSHVRLLLKTATKESIRQIKQKITKKRLQLKSKVLRSIKN